MTDEATKQQGDQDTSTPGHGKLRVLAKLYSGSTILFWPLTDLAMRFFVAQYFFRSGLVKAFNWDTAVLLAREEYPVSWMAPEMAAAIGLSIEIVGPILLLLGLMTRPAAAAMAALTITAQIAYIPTTTNLMLIAILLWYVIHGPAALSLDRAWVAARLKVGCKITHPAIAIGKFLREKIAPIGLLVMRLWLAAAFLALAGIFEPSIAVATWLPSSSFSGTPDWLALLFAALFVLGFGATPLSYALTFLIGYFMIAGAHPDVTFYPVLLLAVYEARGAGLLSIDGWIEGWVKKRFPASDANEAEDNLPVDLVIAAGTAWHWVSRIFAKRDGEAGPECN